AVDPHQGYTPPVHRECSAIYLGVQAVPTAVAPTSSSTAMSSIVLLGSLLSEGVLVSAMAASVGRMKGDLLACRACGLRAGGTLGGKERLALGMTCCSTGRGSNTTALLFAVLL